MSDTVGLLDPAPDRFKRKLAEPLRPARVLAKPKGFVPLRTFSCGGKGSFSEKLINKWALETFRGRRLEQETTVIALEDAHNRLLGVSSFWPSQLNDAEERTARNSDTEPAYYLHIVAVDARYRGQRLTDGSRPGDALMRATLEQMERIREGRMPRVWAIIRPENGPAQDLFERHGFRVSTHLSENEIIYSRRRAPTRGGTTRVFGRIARMAGGGGGR